MMCKQQPKTGGKYARNRGRRGQTAAANILRSRDWTVADLSAGVECEDIIATDPDGRTWSVEVKNTRAHTIQHISQANEQARRRKLPWMLMWHRHGSSEWFVFRQGQKTQVWGGDE